MRTKKIEIKTLKCFYKHYLKNQTLIIHELRLYNIPEFIKVADDFNAALNQAVDLVLKQLKTYNNLVYNTEKYTNTELIVLNAAKKSIMVK